MRGLLLISFMIRRIIRIVIGPSGFRVFKKRARIKKRKNNDYLVYKEKARQLVWQRLVFLNKIYQVEYFRVSIRDQRSRWGSCSKKGNLNFNYRLIHLPPELCDYVIVHELCHLIEFNHSEKFWDQVAKTFPNYRELRMRLKKFKLNV